MAQYQKFLFDNFVISCNDDVCVAEPLDDAEKETDEVIVAEPVTDEPKVPEQVKETVVEVTPSYTQDELDAAVTAAEERGYDKGFAAASSEREQQQQAVLTEVNTRLLALLAGADEQAAAQEQAAMRLAVELVRKLLPSLEEGVAKQEIEAFLADSFADFKRQNSLSFSFHPEMAAVVAPLLSKLAEKNDFEGKIAVHKDINLGLSDCRVEWKNGGVEKSADKTLAKVEELLK